MIFKRYELKYLLTRKQKLAVLEAMKPYMELDRFGRDTIRNIYYDTDNYRLIRNSMDKPIYKEKLRVRSYRQVSGDDKVFIELKKKYDSVVYKRRIEVGHDEAMEYLNKGVKLKQDTQITREIDYFVNYYETLTPKVFLTYEREAYFTRIPSSFRVTFDENILWRQEDISLESCVYGNPILEQGMTLMEIKTDGAIPLWMVKVQTEQKIYKTTFSKYGNAYRNIEMMRIGGEYKYA